MLHLYKTLAMVITVIIAEAYSSEPAAKREPYRDGDDFEISKEDVTQATFAFLFKSIDVKLMQLKQDPLRPGQKIHYYCLTPNNRNKRRSPCHVSATYLFDFEIKQESQNRHYKLSLTKSPLASTYKSSIRKSFGAYIRRTRNPFRIDMTLKNTPKKKIKINFRFKALIYGQYHKGKTALITSASKQLTLILTKNKAFLSDEIKSPFLKMNFAFSFYFNPCEPRSDACNGYFHCNEKNEKVCNKHYYGRHCKRYCKPQSNNTDNKRYICDKNGYYVCAKYWYGKDCDVNCKPVESIKTSFTCKNDGSKICKTGFFYREKECVNYCKLKNNSPSGHCRDQFVGDMARTCHTGYSGRLCGKVTCYTNYCKNGGTCKVSSKNTRICLCPSDTAGEQCFQKHSCVLNYCKNFGECGHHGGKLRCSCLSGYKGKRCEIEPIVKKIHATSNEWDIRDTKVQILVGVMVFTFIYTLSVVWYCGPHVLGNCSSRRY